jgi:hypothetical protein
VIARWSGIGKLKHCGQVRQGSPSLPLGHNSHDFLVCVARSIDRDERIYTAFVGPIVSSFDANFFASPIFRDRIEGTINLIVTEPTEPDQQRRYRSKDGSASRRSGDIRNQWSGESAETSLCRTPGMQIRVFLSLGVRRKIRASQDERTP